MLKRQPNGPRILSGGRCLYSVKPLRKNGNHRENLETTLRVEGSEDREGGGVSRPYTYAGGDPTKTIVIEFHGVFEGKEQYDAVRTVWGTEIPSIGVESSGDRDTAYKRWSRT